jgi:hypothetical protein
MRNIFVYNGRLITVIEYNKTRASTNNSFYIVRVLPLVVSKILFQYIAYVRPFCEALVHQLKLQRSKVPAYYLFASRDYVYSSDILSRAINRQSRAATAGSLSIATYRQGAVAIAKQHIVQIAKNFDLEHSISDRDPLLGIARQSGHRIETLISSYALDQAYPTSVGNNIRLLQYILQ